MSSRKSDFSESDKVKALLWCNRHCCLCDKAAGVGIELAHLDPKLSDLDNAIPLCFDCHAAIGHYNKEHPRGRKYSNFELKARREQVYELHTRHLVPPIEFHMDQQGRKLPDVGFNITNLGNTYPVRVRVLINVTQGNRFWGPPNSEHYNGNWLWNLNPGFGIKGHFTVPQGMLLQGDPLRTRVDVTVIDIYEREHKLLPVGFVLKLGERPNWYFEPSEKALDILG